MFFCAAINIHLFIYLLFIKCVVYCLVLLYMYRSGCKGSDVKCPEKNVLPQNRVFRYHTFRDRRPGTTACPGCYSMGWRHIKWNSVLYGEEKYLVLGWPEQPKQEKVSYTGMTSPTYQPIRDPFHLYSLSRHSSHFQQSVRATLSGLSGLSSKCLKRLDPKDIGRKDQLHCKMSHEHEKLFW